MAERYLCSGGRLPKELISEYLRTLHFKGLRDRTSRIRHDDEHLACRRNCAFDGRWFSLLIAMGFRGNHFQARVHGLHTPQAQSCSRIRHKGMAEMAQLEQGIPGPCVVLAQESKDALLTLISGNVANGKLTRLDMCGALSSWSAKRSGEYPGLTA